MAMRGVGGASGVEMKRRRRSETAGGSETLLRLRRSPTRRALDAVELCPAIFEGRSSAGLVGEHAPDRGSRASTRRAWMCPTKCASCEARIAYSRVATLGAEEPFGWQGRVLDVVPLGPVADAMHTENESLCASTVRTEPDDSGTDIMHTTEKHVFDIYQADDTSQVVQSIARTPVVCEAVSELFAHPLSESEAFGDLERKQKYARSGREWHFAYASNSTSQPMEEVQNVGEPEVPQTSHARSAGQTQGSNWPSATQATANQPMEEVHPSTLESQLRLYEYEDYGYEDDDEGYCVNMRHQRKYRLVERDEDGESDADT